MSKLLDNQKLIANGIFGYSGRHFGSKSFYNHINPEHIVVFNANLITSEGKIWHGDIDVTLEEEELLKLAKKLNTKVYLLYEMDARFENEDSPKIDRAIAIIGPDSFLMRKWDLYPNKGLTMPYERGTRGKFKGFLIFKKKYHHDMSHLYGKLGKSLKKRLTSPKLKGKI